MSPEEIGRVEDIANDFVLQNSPVTTRLMALDEARASGARALFGEKYGDEVRVVAMGESGGNALGWSVELCGGTHVVRTGDIGIISGVSDSGVAAGVRRIEAMTGEAARKHLAEESRKLNELAGLLKVPVGEIDVRVGQLIDERKRIERELTDAKKKLAMGGGGQSGAAEFEDVGGVKVMAKSLSGIDAKDLKSLADDGKKKLGSGIVVLLAEGEEGKASAVQPGAHRRIRCHRPGNDGAPPARGSRG
jgi:alanyl-tRNA synthetase